MRRLVNLGDLVEIRTGKLDANVSSVEGEFPFFTCAREPLRIDKWRYDMDAILVAGNGDLNVKHYKGKFDAYQRTYILNVRNSEVLDTRYLYYFIDSYLETLRAQSIGGIIKYIKLGMLAEAKVPLLPLIEQRRIAAILNQADALRRKRMEVTERLSVLSGSLLNELFGVTGSNSHFPVLTLGDVTLAVSDGPHVSPSYVSNGVPFFSTRNIRPGRIDRADVKYISRADAEVQWRKVKPERGDVLYTKGGTTGIAKAVDFDGDFAVWVHVAVLKLNKTLVDPVWLENMLNSTHCYRQSQILTKGIANRDLGLRRMVQISFPVPPLDLQKRYAHQVSQIDNVLRRSVESHSHFETLFLSLQHRAFAGELSPFQPRQAAE